MSTALEATPANATPFPIAVRAFGYMTDGRPLALIPEHSGAIVREFHLYQGDVARTTWTKKITLTVPDNVLYCSMVVDGSNNVHLIFVREVQTNPATQAVQYVRWDYTSGTNTFAQAVNQLTGHSFGPAGVDVVESVDITVLTGTVPAVTYQWIDVNKKRHVDIAVRRSSDNVWQTQRVRDQTANISPDYRRNQCLISANKSVEANGTVLVVHTYHLHDVIAGANTEFYAMRRVYIHPATGAFTGGVVLREAGLNDCVGAMLWSTFTNNWTWVAAGPFNAHYATIDGSTGAISYTIPGHQLHDGGLNTGLAYFGFSLAGSNPVISCTAVARGGGVRRLVSCQLVPTNARGYLEVQAHLPIYLEGLSENYWLSAGGYRASVQIVDLLTWSDTRDTFLHHWNESPNATHGVSVVVPEDGATVTTDLPLLALSFTTTRFAPYANLSGLVELSKDPSFTVVDRVVDFVDLPDDPAVAVPLRTRVWSLPNYSGAANSPARLLFTVTLADQLQQGTWYARGLLFDGFGNYSGWSTIVDFVVSHPPSAAKRVPTAEGWRLYDAAGVALGWTFDDTSPPDSQTAYQIVVERNDTLELVHDTGKVGQTGVPVDGDTTATVIIPATHKEKSLRWKVRLWDSDDVMGEYSEYDLFRIGDNPTVTITAPAEAGVVATPAPTVTWTLATGSARYQSQYRVVFSGDNGVLHDSGFVTSEATSYTPPLAVLENNKTYTVSVTLRDSGGFSTVDTNAFSVSYVVPAVPTFTVSTATYDTAGYVLVDWSTTTGDAEFAAWRVYRKNVDTGEVVLLDEILGVSTKTFRDYLASSDVTYQYAVTETVYRFGVLLENSRDTSFPTHQVTPMSDNYWLIHPDDETRTVVLHHVTDDQFTEEYEQETLNLLGRGRKTDYGTRFGYTGTLTIQLYDVPTATAREQRIALEALKAEKRELYLRNPFGDLWQVTAGDIGFARAAGVGRREFGVVSIPYTEVA